MTETPNNSQGDSDGAIPVPTPLTPIQRRILGVLIEKARTTPESYPLTLNALVNGSNQKSNRSPVMHLQPEQVEDELVELRSLGAVAEVHGGGRVPKYRHYASDFLGVKGVETGILAELLLRGEQTAGDLRSRASRFEPIADLATLQGILDQLIERQRVIPLTPAGRGQLFTHNFYQPDELSQLRDQYAGGRAPAAVAAPAPRAGLAASGAVSGAGAAQEGPSQVTELKQEIEELRTEVSELRESLERLTDRLDRLES